MTLVWKSGYSFDSDASTYIDAVETADGQALETGVRVAINDFVLGCKQDGIWNAIKASCILAGARTLDGALVPLVGSAPTKQGTEAGWNYNRETGLKGNGTDNSLDSGLNMFDVPLSSVHQSVSVSAAGTSSASYIGGTFTGPSNSLTEINWNASGLIFRSRNVSNSYVANGEQDSTGFMGTSRDNSSNFDYRLNGTTGTVAAVALSSSNGDFSVFRRTGFTPTNARLSFYSIGESLDLALLDTRVSNLITAIGAAIP
jgi:hypothetical protein